MTHPDASPYQVLGIASDATEEEVRRAYREKAKLLHPDRGGSGSGSGTTGDGDGDGEDAFVRVQRAYEALREPEARRRLDAEARAIQLAAAARAARALDVDAEELHFDEGEEGDDDAIAGGGGLVGVWRYECRCGDEFTLSGAELASGAPVACRSCSLVLQVAHGAEAVAARTSTR